MVRIAAGDYLLPSNDGETLWRLFQYDEDGSLVEYPPDDRKHEHGRRVRGKFWNLWRYREPLPAFVDEFALDEEILDDWERWSLVETLLPTRRAAIESALRP
jgi:hypothetical protein